MAQRGYVHYHSPCFDGLVSAGLIIDWLEHRQGWTEIELIPVNYDLRGTWLTKALPAPSAVVDFLYHPQAEFWFDHHGTTFLSEAAERDFQNRKASGRLIYDPRAASCAGLIARALPTAPRWNDAVQWAEKIDAARYDSVHEAILGDAAALRISASLAHEANAEFCGQLVHALRHLSLEEAANLAPVRQRYDHVRTQTHAGLKRFGESAHMEGEIVAFDVQAADVMVNRYAPYFFFPEARYSVGVVRTRHGAKITTMRNPWIEFDCVHLGRLCAELGGGGHERVGSIALPPDRVAEIPMLLARIQSAITAPVQ